MAILKREASAHWEGSGAEGKGTLTGPSGTLSNTPYSFKTRFQSEDGKAGTNPEELIAAAHAGCFSMALSFGLGGAGFTPNSIDTTAHLEMEQQPQGGWKIARITLKLKADVPNLAPDQLKQIAEGAKANCPVSQALAAVPISLEIQ